MSRRPPLEHVGNVAIYAPTGTTGTARYYRIKWIEPDGRRGDTSAGVTIEQARWKGRRRAVGSAKPPPDTPRSSGGLVVPDVSVSPRSGSIVWRIHPTGDEDQGQ